MSVDSRFVVERQGKSFVLYQGLLDLAHSQGLRAIRTQLIQIPDESNGQVAIVRAEVETDRGTFSGIGDASPSNVARAMLTATIRLAETRAKARALRDAVNVGVVAFEETGDGDEGHGAESSAPTPQRTEQPAEIRHVAQPARPQQPSSSPSNGQGPASGGPLASTAQVRAIYAIGRSQHTLSEAEIEERSMALFGAKPADLSKRQASEFITRLKGEAP